MLGRNKIGVPLFWLLGFLTILLWLITFGDSTLNHNAKASWILISQGVAVAGFAFFALSFVLAARFKWLEDYFDGLDKMLHFHHRISVFSGILILAHPLLLALRWIPEDMHKMMIYVLPLHRRMAVNLGSAAFFGFLILMALSLFVKLPYHKWRITHKFFGLIFIIAALHIFLLQNLIWNNLWLAVYLLLLSAAAVYSWLYKTFYLEYFAPHPEYLVSGVNHLNPRTVEITLAPVAANQQLSFTCGQFCFFRFKQAGISREAHPFTICSASGATQIKIMVKALGDYTNRLVEQLKPGAKAFLEGPYGRFCFLEPEKSQVWISGGVGITPFLSQLRTCKAEAAPTLRTDLYYCVNTRSEAVFLNELREFEQMNEHFRVHIIAAETEGFMNADKIQNLHNRDIYICGPLGMRTALLQEFKKMNIPSGNIHYEDFDFFKRN